jgi:hypothetical protein
MQKIAIIVCLITFAPVWAENETDGQSFLSYEEWREMTGSSQDKEDCIVLVDGKRITGTLVKLPSLTYNFVKMEFDPAEIKTISVVKHQNNVKIQYITREGQNYIGNLAEGKFAFWISDPSLKDPSHMVEKELEPKFVNFIVLANRESKTPHTNPQLGSLELINGDHVPIAIMSNPILLTDGWSDKKIKAEDVLELCFDGGVHGKILDNGAEANLGFMYAKDQYILIQIPRNQYLVKLPWSQVSYIQGHNGGFRQQKQGRELFNTTYFQEDAALNEIGTMLTGYQNTNPDCLGIEKGTLLNGALCATAISSKAITEAGQLGCESLIAMEQLFDSSEGREWLTEIEIEEFAEEDPIVAIMEATMLDDLMSILDSKELVRQEASQEDFMDFLADMELEELEFSEREMIIVFDNEAVPVEEEEKQPEEVMTMILDNELEIYDDLNEIKVPEWTLDIAFEGNKKEDFKEKEERKALIGIDEIVIDHEDLEEETTEDILWAEKESSDGNSSLTPKESLFIEEFLTGETPAQQPIIFKKTHHVR